MALALGSLLGEGAVMLDARADDREAAIRLVGGMLVAGGVVDEVYVEAMLDREASVSTAIGEGIAIPHATLAGGDSVHRDGIAVARFPSGVLWGTETVTVVIGLAARGRGHIALLARLARMLLDSETSDRLRTVQTVPELRVLFEHSGRISTNLERRRSGGSAGASLPRGASSA
ncbi:MAG: hypothetical protein RI885_766 [Actinomycetota bacterium]|jgi:PTS system mannitol-specific IIA component